MNKCQVWKCIGFALLSFAVVAMGFIFYYFVQYSVTFGIDKGITIWILIAAFFTVIVFVIISKIIISFLVDKHHKKNSNPLLYLILFITPDFFFTDLGKRLLSSNIEEKDKVDALKESRLKKDNLLISFNLFNLCITIIGFIVATILYKEISNELIRFYLVSIVTFRFISRVLEIMIAFGFDVIENKSHGGSKLRLIQRIGLAISSIIEIFLLVMIAYILLSSSGCGIFDTLLSGLTGDSCSCCQCVSSSVDPCLYVHEYYLTTITISSRLAMLFIVSFVILEYIKIWRNKNKAEILYVNEIVNDKTIPVIADTLRLEECNKIINSYIWTISIGKRNIRILFNDHYYHCNEIAISNRLSENLKITDIALNDLELNNTSAEVLEVKITFFKRDSDSKNISVTIEPLK